MIYTRKSFIFSRVDFRTVSGGHPIGLAHPDQHAGHRWFEKMRKAADEFEEFLLKQLAMGICLLLETNSA